MKIHKAIILVAIIETIIVVLLATGMLTAHMRIDKLEQQIEFIMKK